LSFPTIETDRLMLREIKEDDASELFVNFSNDELMKYYGSEQMESLQEAVELINVFRMNFLENRGYRWGIQIKGEQGLIGTIGFHAWSPKNKRAEIGYEINPDYWKKGYAKESISAVLEYGFSALGLKRIGAVVFLENDSSNELLLKLGFQKEGILRNYIVQKGQSFDTIVYSIIR
jgi:[ribosomal protein S5]-alanine N-acetyltransferase